MTPELTLPRTKMSLLISMLPFYLVGNLHCLGMCGPLVMMIGAHRYRLFYFAGRLASFTLAGLIAGEAGAVLNVLLSHYHLSAAISFAFGGIILTAGAYSLLGKALPGQNWLAKLTANANRQLSLLMLRDTPLATFLFGFSTIALPCGQSLIVFAACALAGDPWKGVLNGFCFALLTSPSLFFAMRAHMLLGSAKRHYNTLVGIAALLAGSIALCRGLAEVGFIEHLSWKLPCVANGHLVIY